MSLVSSIIIVDNCQRFLRPACACRWRCFAWRFCCRWFRGDVKREVCASGQCSCCGAYSGPQRAVGDWGDAADAAPTIPAGGRVLVVADNCGDATAAIAGVAAQRKLSSESIASGAERASRLDFGIAHLRQNPPACVVFLDADCQVRPDTVRLLAAAAMRRGGPCRGSICAIPIRTAACCRLFRPGVSLQKPRSDPRAGAARRDSTI